MRSYKKSKRSSKKHQKQSISQQRKQIVCHICMSCKKEFYCLNLKCIKRDDNYISTKCHCPKCTKEINIEREKKNRLCLYSIDDCGKAYTIKELVAMTL